MMVAQQCDEGVVMVVMMAQQCNEGVVMVALWL